MHTIASYLFPLEEAPGSGFFRLLDFSSSPPRPNSRMITMGAKMYHYEYKLGHGSERSQ